MHSGNYFKFLLSLVICFITHCNGYFGVNEVKTFAEAEAYCNAHGSSLASIHSAEQNTEVQSICVNELGSGWCYIGINDIDSAGQWQWSDGTDTSYTSWWTQGDHPNSCGAPYDCAMISSWADQSWHCRHCTTDIGKFICNDNQWVKGLTLGLPDNSYEGEIIDIGQSQFNQIFQESALHIFKRDCAACPLPLAFYRRLTDQTTFDVYSILRDFTSANNLLGINFNIYSTFNDALANTNAWQVCNYDDSHVGAFRDCGPTNYVGCGFAEDAYGGNRYGSCGKSARFSILTSPTFNPTSAPTKTPSQNPTNMPTNNPTQIPTSVPTNNPTKEPTQEPTNNPTVSPTHLNCEKSGEIKHINWNELQNSINNEIEVPFHSFNVSINTNTLEFTFNIDLQYLGLSTDGNYDNNYNLPTTYHIGFDAFPTLGRLINEAGNCENRVVLSYDGISDFNAFFGYSEYPYLANNMGSDNYLSYPPPSEHWTLSVKDNECSPINYNGIFNWNELTQCSDFNGDNLISIVDNGESLTLTGTLYVYVISPYSVNNGIDTGYYRTYPLIQQDFTLLITKQVNVLSSTNTQLFTASIIGIHEDVMDKSFKVNVLTQSADYIKLINPQILATPFANIDQISMSSIGVSSCLTTSSYTCGQIFSITINETEINCPPADFSGVYDMSFDVECRDNSAVCQVFIDDNSGPLVLLDVESNFVDYTCQLKSYEMEFEAAMTFYDDSDFLNQHNAESGNYVIGKDTIYAEIVVNYPDDGSGDNLFIFGIEIQNVFVCTVNDSIDLSLDSNGNFEGESGGCLSADIDIDGPYNIIINGIEDSFYNAQIIPYLDESNVVRFSFLTFNIGRTKMYIHVQLTLILQNGERRRLGRLLSTDLNGEEGSNQIRHFSGSVNVIHKTTDTNILTTEYSNPEIHTSNTSLNKHLFSVLFVFLCFIIF